MAITRDGANATFGNKTTGATSAIITLTAAIPAGHTVVAAIALDPASGTVSCSDSAGNTYTQEINGAQGSGTSGVRLTVFVAYNITNALSIGSTITISHPAAAARAALTTSYASVLGLSAKENPANTGAAGSVASDAVTSSDANCVALFICAVESATVPTSFNWTFGSSNASSGGGSSSNVAIGFADTLTVTGSQGGSATITNNAAYACAVLMLKPQLTQRYMPVFTTTI
jgi:hypothetical protein